MIKTLYTTICCILIFAQIACEQTQPNNVDLKTQPRVVEPETSTKIEEIKDNTKETKTDYPNLKTQADAMGRAFSTNDFDKFADFMYPKLVEMSGGRDKFIASLSASMKQAKSTGFELVGYEVGEPTQITEIDNQIFSVLPTKTTMKFPQKTMTDQGSILAVSEDKGNNWKFVRVKTKESIRPLFPNAVDKLTFPETTIK